MSSGGGGPRILLTGATGQMGHELLTTLAGVGDVLAPGRAEMDFADGESVRAAVRRMRPRWIVNAAAYTAVDKAESEPELAAAVNAGSVAALGEEARALGAGVVHFSTDYVFDGRKKGLYTEEDATAPASVYGRTKLDGENALRASEPPHLIFRTSWVFGAEGKNFVRTILRLAREREVVRVVSDQHGSPTWSRDLARLTAHAIEACEQRTGGRDSGVVPPEMSGVFHACGSGSTTWFEFAKEALAAARGREPHARWATVEAIPTAEYPTPARRPMNSRMDCGRLRERFGWEMMEWRESLHAAVAEMGASFGERDRVG